MSKFIDRLLDPDSQREEGQGPIRLRRLPSAVGWLAIVVIAGIYLATGIYTVGTSDEGLVKRFGRYVRTVDPGLHYHLPAPFESVVTVNVRQVRKTEIGFRTISAAPNPRYQSIDAEALMLTEDGNIARVEMVVQYLVNDSMQYAFNLIDASEIVKQAAEAVMREQVATKTLDETLTEQRDTIGVETKLALQELLNAYGVGILIANVQLQDVTVPSEVLSAFYDVSNARQDKEKLINEASRYALDIVPRARGQAQEIGNQAEGYKQTRIKGAEGDVARFVEVLAKYEVGEVVTRTRLYIEAMEEILPNMDKIIVSGQEDGLLKLLNLDSAGGGQ
jgi:membrane protease subunit HflK